MSTSDQLWFQDLKLGADGFVPAQADTSELSDGCCTDPLCTPSCDVSCAYVDLLPTGPLWDRQKALVTELLTDATDCDAVLEADCPSMALYAAYVGRTLHSALTEILWPRLREGDPRTAVETLDDWLLRYAWQDCYRQNCRSVFLQDISPYERLDECGDPFYCETDFGDEFDCALKHAILQSLVRSQRGVIKNLDGLNWIIEPLGATIRPRTPYPDEVQQYLDDGCEDDDPCFCDMAELEICNSTTELAGCPPLVCGDPVVAVPAQQAYTCDGEAVMLYPAVLAAECIIRSLLPRRCPNIVYRCDDVVIGEPVVVDPAPVAEFTITFEALGVINEF